MDEACNLSGEIWLIYSKGVSRCSMDLGPLTKLLKEKDLLPISKTSPVLILFLEILIGFVFHPKIQRKPHLSIIKKQMNWR